MDQPQLIQLPKVLFPRGHEVNPCGLNAAVPQHIGQSDHVVAGAIEGPGEQAAEVVGEHLAPLHARRFAEGLHAGPDRLSRDRETVLGKKNLARGDFLLFGVLLQFAAQPVGEQDGPNLALQRNLRYARPNCLYGDVLQLAHPDTGGTDGLQDQLHPQVALLMGRLDQALVLLLGQIFFGFAKHLPLELQILHLAILPAHADEKLVHRRQHGVHRDRAITGLGQRRLPLHGQLFGDCPAIRPFCKPGQGAEVGFDGGFFPLVVAQVVLELVKFPLRQLQFLLHV